MEKLVANEKRVQASTLPILRFTNGNVNENENERAVHFDLRTSISLVKITPAH
jgi:hypothetical protein